MYLKGYLKQLSVVPQDTGVETQGEKCLKNPPLSWGLICHSQVRSKCGHVPDLVSLPYHFLRERFPKSNWFCPCVFTAVCCLAVTSSWKRDFQHQQDSPKDRQWAESPNEVLEATTNKQLTQGTQSYFSETHFPSRLQDSRLHGLMSWNQAQAQHVIKTIKRKSSLPTSFN